MRDKEAEERRLKSLAELSAEWERRLAPLQDPKAGERVDAMMDAQGRIKRRPKAGETY